MKELFKELNFFAKKYGDKIGRYLEKKFDTKEKIVRKMDLALFILALLSLFVNMSACVKVFANAPINERISRPAMARASSWFYASGPLEPLPVFALKVPMLVSKANPIKIQRAEGCIVFVLIFFAFIKVVSARVSRSAALYSSVILAGIPWLGYYAMTGSAMLFSLLFLLLYWDYSDISRLNYERAVYAGLCAAAACLCRTESVFFIIINTLFFIPECKAGSKWRHIGLVFAIMIFLSAPYFIWQKAHFGNAFYGQEMGLTRLINAEISNLGLDKEYVKQPSSLFQFLFRDGFMAALAAPFKGLLQALTFEFPRAIYYKIAILFAFIGLYFSYMKSSKIFYSLWLSAFIPVCFFAYMNIVQRNGEPAGGIPLEYYLSSLPGIIAAAGYGLQESCRYFSEWLARKYPQGFKR